jgi:hypothetical protein
LDGARFDALRFVAAFFADFCVADFFAGFFAGDFFAAFFGAVLRRAAGALDFAALRAVFRVFFVGLIVVSGSSAQVSAGAVSIAERGFMRAGRFVRG